MRAGRPLELILVRHPRPDIAPGLCYGAADVAANADALAAASAALGPRLAPLLARGYRLYSSPLLRCRALAECLGQPVLDARLAEMHFGAWEMQSWDSIARGDVDAWAADLLHYRPGGGESVAEVAARVASFLASLEHDAILICHAGTMRLMAALAAGTPVLQAAAQPHRIAYGELLRLSLPAKSV